MDLTVNVRQSKGLYIGLLIVLIPTVGWVFHYDFSSLSSTQILSIAIAKVGAFAGLSMFAVSLIAGNKTVWLDNLFGGLDKMYITHRIFGVISLFLLLLHPLGLVLLRLHTTSSGTFSFLLGLRSFEIFLGAVALYGMLAIVLWSLYAKTRHETFITVHRLLGLLFVIGALHAFLSGSILAEAVWLQVYLLSLTIIAAGMFISYTLLSDVLHRPYVYKVVSSTEKTNNITEVVLEPLSRIVRFNPGQFIYIRFNQAGLQEYHPFSVASGIYDRELRLAVRKAGDFTKALSTVKPGVNVYVKGPYGGFTFFDRRYQKQLWIAGGIGVTPFLSKARSLPKKFATPHQIEMIYATGDKHPYGYQELQAISQRNKSLHLTLFHEEKFGYVSLQSLIEHLKDVHERAIFVCGPPPLMKAVAEEAEALGMSHQLHYEEFSY